MSKTKEEILKKVNEICEKRKFNLVESNRVKYAENAVKRFDGESADETAIFQAMETELETAYHFQSGALANATVEFSKKEAELKKELEEAKKAQVSNGKTEDPKTFEIPEDMKSAMEYYKKMKESESINAKRKSVYDLFIKDVNDTQKKSAETFFNTQTIGLDDDISAKATELKEAYTQIIKAEIGDNGHYVSTSAQGGGEAEKITPITF